MADVEKILDKDFLQVSDEEITFLAHSGGYEVTKMAEDEIKAKEMIEEEGLDTGSSEAIRFLSECVMHNDFDAFADFEQEHKAFLINACAYDKELASIIVTGYKLGVRAHHSLSANNLGALYYTGDIVEKQDFEKAKDLYELGEAWGCTQSMINLGYIYEYGRCGEKDPLEAFKHFATAAALDSAAWEALYKLGDMYARGKGVDKNESLALKLWEKSYDIAKEEAPHYAGHAAFRIAPLCLETGLDRSSFSPILGLKLYQEAEQTFLFEMENGAEYYKKNLKEARAGQETARCLMQMR